MSLCTFSKLKRAWHWFGIGSFICCQLLCFNKDPLVIKHVLTLKWFLSAESPLPFNVLQRNYHQRTIKVVRVVLWLVGGTDGASVNLQLLVSLLYHPRLSPSFCLNTQSGNLLRMCEENCSCSQERGNIRSDQPACGTNEDCIIQNFFIVMKPFTSHTFLRAINVIYSQSQVKYQNE